MTSIQFGGHFFRIPVKQPGEANVPAAISNMMTADQLVEKVRDVYQGGEGLASVNFYQATRKVWVQDGEPIDASHLIGKLGTDTYADVSFKDNGLSDPKTYDDTFKRLAKGYDIGIYAPS